MKRPAQGRNSTKRIQKIRAAGEKLRRSVYTNRYRKRRAGPGGG